MAATVSSRIAPLVLSLAVLVAVTKAHEHHDDKIPEGEGISPDPIDTTLWIHIAIQILSFGLIFPTGMVLGISKSRFHVPLQTTGALLSLLGYILGHKHKGRQFAPNIHASLAFSVMSLLVLQVVLGIYLRLHLEKGIHARIRPVIRISHSIVGKVFPVVSWVQMLLGGIVAMGFCRGDHLGQCLAHFIMGSAFIGYGIVLTILLLVGQAWLKRTGRSQEFFDSLVIAAWGCVNTFTEHRWGGPWVANDLQHTSMGIVWWCAGLLGVWLSRGRDGRPRRNLIPGMVILMTGWAMSAHPQHLELSTHVHTIFGYTLMAAGAVRIIEISFVLKDKNTVGKEVGDMNSFQMLTPFLLYASGFLFMGATEEQLALLSEHNVTHVSYILLLYSIAFLLFLYVNVLLYVYAESAWPRGSVASSTLTAPTANGGIKLKDEGPGRSRLANGHAHTYPNGTVDGRVRDAEEFELEGLMSGDEGEDEDLEGVDGRERRRKEGEVMDV
ncbi:hypothetical protein MMC25_003835 [Agyrium rufum]|nr:hypothetical protein [Agyrium rufum]